MENYFEKVYIACKEKQDLKAIGNLYHLLDYVKNSKQDSFIPLLSQSEVHYNELLRYIHQHYFQDITIASMAADNNIDRTYIFKLFKKYQHTSPSQYLLEYRLDKACMLLMKTSLSVTDISYAVGFQNAPDFSRQFTKQKRDDTLCLSKKIFKNRSCLNTKRLSENCAWAKKNFVFCSQFFHKIFVFQSQIFHIFHVSYNQTKKFVLILHFHIRCMNLHRPLP